MLDNDELLHLALKEMQGGSNEKAITHLKTCLQQDPQNANAQYLLGALHAELGMYERATQEMEAALNLDPELSTARFQLGLLYITSGNVEKSQETWHDLAKLGDEHPLYLFKEGMLHLAKNEFKECIALLKKGIALNTLNEALNNDMLEMMSRAQEALNNQQTEVPVESSSLKDEQPKAKSNISLDAYQSQDDVDVNH